ncbi:MAG: AAA family ATPase [Bacteriovoracaceae bacterium]|nr:AAA family ATPase [Bacteriovoracaceae bacterium]
MSFIKFMDHRIGALLDEKNQAIKEDINIESPNLLRYNELYSEGENVCYSISLEKLGESKYSFLENFKSSQLCRVEFKDEGRQLSATIDKDSENLYLYFQDEISDFITNLRIIPISDLVLSKILGRYYAWKGQTDDGPTEEDTRILKEIEKSFEKIETEKEKLDSRRGIPEKTEVGYTKDYFINYIWGPPGTGKTHSSSNLIKELIKDDETTLIVSISNQAVDNILIEFLKNVESDEYQKKAVRIGRSLRKNHSLIKDNLPRAVFEDDTLDDYYDEIDLLREKLKGLKRDEKVKVLASIQELRIEINSRVRSLIQERKMTVFATVAQVFVNNLFEKTKFDNVIVEEASMVPLPLFYSLSYLARKRIYGVGDPKQIRPVVISSTGDTVKYLSETVFDIFNLTDPTKLTPNCSFLSLSHRMPRNITSVISEVFYKGVLKGKDELPSSNSINLVDLEGNGFQSVQQTGLFCKEAADRVASLVKDKKWSPEDVAIITPFRKQRLEIIHALKRLELPDFKDRVFTIHSSQGDGFKYVVFDTAHYGDCSPSIMLRTVFGKKNISSEIINVAISRVKSELYVFYDSYFISKNKTDLIELSNIIKLLKSSQE